MVVDSWVFLKVAVLLILTLKPVRASLPVQHYHHDAKLLATDLCFS
jgi:hypothetical protein